MTAALTATAAALVGVNLWFLFEYLLHRFAMHQLHGRGIMSREHLLHHVGAGWTFSYTSVLSWIGVGLVGGAVWFPVGWWLAGWPAGVGVATGWVAGYAFYEYQHAAAHLRAPRNRYQRWLRIHHFHHHFGRPMSNHGVSIPLWDIVFGTRDRPEVVRVPRRLAAGLGWLMDDRGELRPEYEGDYVLVGSVSSDERQAGIDRARAFASLAPTA
jgi:sterol desaturase/sphingolipid hydroxylase (fatty acid hydroxylase superfamily)